MDFLPIVFAVVLVVVSIVLVAVGVQLMMVLNELKQTLRKVNMTLDTVDQTVSSVVRPLHNLGGMASGLTTGFKVFETFVGWLQRNRQDAKDRS